MCVCVCVSVRWSVVALVFGPHPSPEAAFAVYTVRVYIAYVQQCPKHAPPNGEKKKRGETEKKKTRKKRGKKSRGEIISITTDYKNLCMCACACV
jgi:hypothetical protein